MPGCSWCSHPADNPWQQGTNDIRPQVTERQAKAQEGLSHPDSEAAQEEPRRGRNPDSLQGKESNLNGQEGLGFGRHACGGGERVTHPPAEDRDLAHSAARQVTMGLAIKVHADASGSSSGASPTSLGLHTE